MPDPAPARRPAAPTPAPPTPAPRSTSSVTPGGGQRLPGPTQRALESSFGVDLSAVRLHTGPTAAAAASNLSARAFTYGPQIVLGPNERPTDVGLMAHEVAHVVQQGSAPSIQRSSILDPGDAAEHEARAASQAVLRGDTPVVHEQASGNRVQRWGLSDVLDYFADKANNIPGYRMITILLGFNPINMSRVERSAANILRALIEFMPGGNLITRALDNYGIIDKIAKWAEEQLRTLGDIGRSILDGISRFLDSLGWRDIFHLGDVWDRAKRIFTDPIDRLIDFAKSLAIGIIQFIKDAILMPLAKLAEKTPAWDLLIAILGKNPITGETVPRNADTLIGGFMKLIGQEEVWNNMKKANAVGRAWAWFQTAMAELLGFVMEIPSLFIAALKSLELMDIVLLPRAFLKVARVFAGFAVKFVKWAMDTVWKLLEIIFAVVAPGAVPYLKKASGAFKTILKNPIGFISNLVKAGKQGFLQFRDRIGTHLKNSLIDWLTGSMTGVYIPKSFDFMEIVKFVLSVLGISWQNIRQKLVKVIGEPAVKTLEAGFDIVLTLIREGPGAAWVKIKEQFSNLGDMAVAAIIDYVVTSVVKKAVAKIISFLVPGGAFIQAIITIYDTIMVFISKLKTIIQVATAFLDSIMAIASGSLGPAANKIDTVLAGMLTLAISFLAGFAGLGKIATELMNLLNTKVRAPIDKALDKVVDWIVTTAKKLFAKAVGKDKKDVRTEEEKQRDVKAAASEADVLLKDQSKSPEDVTKALPGIKAKYNLVRIDVVKDSESEEEETDHIIAEINPLTSTSPAKKPRLKTGNTEVTAIPMTWFKPAGIYKPFFLGARQLRPDNATYIDVPPILQSRLGGTKKLIGIGASNIKKIGDVLKRTKSPARGTEKDFKDLLAADGFFWPGTAPDHVQDLGWGGADAFTNLWPLDSGTNSAVNKVYNQDVSYSDNGAKTKSTPMRLIDKFFKVKKVSSP